MTPKKNIASGKLAEYKSQFYVSTNINTINSNLTSYMNSIDTRANGGSVIERPHISLTGQGNFLLIISHQKVITQSLT